MKLFDVLVAGEINPDLILTGNIEPAFGQAEKLVDSVALTVGSSSAIFACGAARLGLKVVFIGVCGDDIFGNFMLHEMSKRSVDISNVQVDPERQTGLSVILNRDDQGDRAILTHSGCISDLCIEDIPEELLRVSRHLHVASYFLQSALQPGLPELFLRAHALGLTTSLDTNWDPSGRWNGLDRLLPLTDVFLPNENEAIAITASSTVEEALNRLGQRAGTVAVKRGLQGALACRGEQTVSACALSGNIVDTVGAGDNFDAGFLYGILNDWNLENALRLAIVCGSLSTRAAGGTTAQPTLKEAMQYVQFTG
jgi:sugar/nucleoside kinase (ribokinase family)